MHATRNRPDRRRGSRPWAWLAAACALLLGLGLPLAPAVHALAGHGEHHPSEILHAASNGGDLGCGLHRAPRAADEPADHEQGPASDHDESSCPVCVQLALAKRAGVAGTPPLVIAAHTEFDRLGRHGPTDEPAPRLGRAGSARGPPAVLATA